MSFFLVRPAETRPSRYDAHLPSVPVATGEPTASAHDRTTVGLSPARRQAPTGSPRHRSGLRNARRPANQPCASRPAWRSSASSFKPARAMAGSPSTKENRAASSRLKPRKSAAVNVERERDTRPVEIVRDGDLLTASVAQRHSSSAAPSRSPMAPQRGARAALSTPTLTEQRQSGAGAGDAGDERSPALVFCNSHDPGAGITQYVPIGVTCATNPR